MSSYPSCLHDGWFLVEFYISHPAGTQYYAINTTFWLQYHTLSELQSPLCTTDAHLIRPSDSLEDYTTRHKLLQCCKWVNLTHQDTFIHGPFEFITVNGRRTQDCISQPDWDFRKAHCDIFHFRVLMCHHILFMSSMEHMTWFDRNWISFLRYYIGSKKI